MSDRRLRILGYFLIGAIAALAVVLVLLLFLTRTEVGVEQVRRFAVAQIQNRITGELRVGRITTRGLLGGATLHDVELQGPDGRTFISTDSLRLQYRLRTLLTGRIIFSRVTLYRPEVTIERLPGDTLWNYERVFRETEERGPEGPGPLILIEQARIVDGQFVVRFPWEPEPGKPVEPDDTARLILREAPGGLVRELRFEEINANVPRVLWESPVEEGRLFDIRSLATRGYIWETPFDLRDLRGQVTIRDSVIAFDVSRFDLPATHGSAIGEVITGEDRTRFNVRIEGDEVDIVDLQWLYPDLPDEGGGSLVFSIQSQPVGTLWLAENARIHAPGTNIAGTFGIVTGDTLYFTQVNLRASPLNLELLQEILPGDLPIEGLMIGTVEVEGPISSLTTRGDLRLARAGAVTPSSVRWSGTVDLDGSFGAQNFVADLDALDLGIVSALASGAHLAGTLSGRIEATGRLEHMLRVAGSLRHTVVDGPESRFEGNGTLTRGVRRPRLELLVQAEPLDLEALSAMIPGLGKMRGQTEGTVAVKGEFDNLEIIADLASEVGTIAVEGQLDLTAPTPRYVAEGRLSRLRLDKLISGLERDSMIVDARFDLDGEGGGLAQARADLRFLVDSAWLGHLAVRSGNAGVRIEDGVLRIDSLVARTDAGTVEASGTLGLTEGRDGRLRVRVAADSLHALEPFFFPAPGILDEDTVRYRVAGVGILEAEIRGGLGDLALDGGVRFRDLIYDDADARRVDLSFSAAGIGTDSISYQARVNADSLDVYGQRLSRANASLEYVHPEGRIVFDAGSSGDEASRYRLTSGFQINGTGFQFDLQELFARTGAEAWNLAAPASIQLGRRGIAVDELLLVRAEGNGSVRVAGRLPWIDPERGSGEDLPADFHLDFQDLPFVKIGARPAPRPGALASLTGKVRVKGTAFDPRMEAELSLANLAVGDVRLEKIGARLRYQDQLLETTLEADDNGRRVIAGTGRIPLDLRLAPVAERRLAEPLAFTLKTDGLSAAVATLLDDQLRNVEGSLDGTVLVSGTTRDPRLGGQILLRDGAATWRPAGVRFRGVSGTFRMVGERVIAVDATARTAGGGIGTVSGTLDFHEIDDPRFDLMLLARNFQAAHRRDVELTGTGEVRLTGRFSAPRVEARIRVDKGTLYLDEVWRQYQIVALDDPLLFDAIDIELPSEPVTTSPFLKNLSVGAEIEMVRETWLRSRNLNVEVAGNLLVALNRTADEIRLTGTLNAIRGTYELQVAEGLPARRFTVRGGTVEFDGTPGINPAFDIIANSRVRATDREPLTVQAVVTGSLQAPRVSLRSEDEPNLSESDLLSYLVFGRPTYALASGESRQIDSYLTGLGAGLVVPTYFGYVSALASNLGFVDYVAINPGGETGDDNDGLRAFDPFGALGRAQVEVGSYIFDSWYAAVTGRFGQKNSDLGFRLEWRIAPTWTAEAFYEGRYNQTGVIRLDQPLESKKVVGFFFFREWGF